MISPNANRTPKPLAAIFLIEDESGEIRTSIIDGCTNIESHVKQYSGLGDHEIEMVFSYIDEAHTTAAIGSNDAIEHIRELYAAKEQELLARNSPYMVWVTCRSCGFVCFGQEALRTSNPFDASKELLGCPACSAVLDVGVKGEK